MEAALWGYTMGSAKLEQHYGSSTMGLHNGISKIGAALWKQHYGVTQWDQQNWSCSITFQCRTTIKPAPFSSIFNMLYIYENLSNNFTYEIITLLAINFVSNAKLFPFTKRPFERLEIGQGGIYARRAKERILRLPLLNIFRIISAFAHQTS